MSIRVLAALFALPLVSCTEKKEEPVETPTEVGEPAMPEEAPAAEPEQAFVTFVTSMRIEPTDARRIDDPTGKKKKKISNWVMTLYRGEEVTVMEVEADWAKVRASDDSEGWIKKDGLLPTDGATVATVLEDTKTFYRPDLLALNASRTLSPPDLLFVLKTKDQFSEVNRYGQSTVWVLSEKLNTEGGEISAAKLLNKYRWLTDNKKDKDAEQVMELAVSQFGNTKLVELIGGGDEPEEEAAPEGAPEEPETEEHDPSVAEPEE